MRRRARPSRRRSPPGATPPPAGVGEKEAPILAEARDLEKLGIRTAGLLRVEWAAEMGVRHHLHGRAAKPEDLPELIRNLPNALEAPSVRRLLGLLRAAATGTEERMETLPGSPVFYRAGRAPQVPKRFGRYLDAQEDETIARRLRLLASIADAFRDALMKAPRSREEEARRAVPAARRSMLETIEARARAAPPGNRERVREEGARGIGFDGSALDPEQNRRQVLAAFRRELGRARRRPTD